MKRLIMVLVLPWLVWACAAQKPALWKEPGISFQGYHTVEVLPVANETGKSFSDFNVPEELALILQVKLRDKGFSVTGGSGADKILVVKSSLTEYEAGSALARWILPGAGATKCALKVAVSDKQTGKPMSEFIESGSVAAGGLYTIGADRRILGTVAGKVANDLDRLVKGD